MAEQLARIIGTEEDRVNCPFFWKIGTCRHGQQCSRSHYKPSASQTILLRHMYDNPALALAISEGQEVTREQSMIAAEKFDEFYRDVWRELSQYGELEDLIVVDNVGDHMVGNVYAKYVTEEEAATALHRLVGLFYGSRSLEVEYSPVTDFREARCRQFVLGQCIRGGYCNFLHMKHVPRVMKRRCLREMYESNPTYLEALNSRLENSDYRRIDAPTRDWGDGERPDNVWAKTPGGGRGGGNRRGGGGQRGGRRDFNDRDFGGNGGGFGQRGYQNRGREGRDNRETDQRDRHGERERSQERRSMITRWNHEAGR